MKPFLSPRVVDCVARTAIVLAAGLGAADAAAQTPSSTVAGGFAMNRYDPAEAGSEWFSQDSLDLQGRLRPAIGVTADLGYQPQRLVREGSMETSSEQVPLVSHQLYTHLGASLVILERVRAGLELPLAVSEEGNAVVRDGVLYQAPSGGGVGDPRLTVDVRLLGVHGGPFTAAIGGGLWVPAGSKSAFLGDGEVRFQPHLRAAGEVGLFTYAASFGYLVRGDHLVFAGKQIGDELTVGGALGLHLLARRLLVGAEIFGGTVTTGSGNFLGQYTTYLEGMLGVHYTAGAWRTGAGIGPGLTSGVGVPAFRGLFTLEWAPGVAPPSAATPIQPPPSGPVPPRDRDGVDDACPDVAGVRSDDPRKNGCPAPADRDGDGVADALDACPDVAGPPSDDPTKNGCPAARVEGGQIRILEKINFATLSAETLPEAMPLIAAVAKVLHDAPRIKKVRVEGHTDGNGGRAANRVLSQRRAEAVAAALLRAGIDQSRLSSVGLGQDRPIDTNATEAGRSRNRRVEFHIVDGDAKPR